MKKIVLLLLITIPALSQDSKDILTDSTLVIGVSRGAFLYEQPNSGCRAYSFDKYLYSGTMFVISGMSVCPTYGDDEIYCHVIYRGEKYLLKSEDMLFYDIEGFQDYFLRLSDADKSTFELNAIKYEKILQAKHHNDFKNLLEKSKLSGITLLNYGFYRKNEYSDAVSVDVSFYNTGRKVIKYIWFTFIGINPVGDRVIDKYTGSANKTLKGVGPVEPDDVGAYSFDDVWYSKLIKDIKVTNIKIQYMDGAIKTVKPNKDNMLSREIYNYLLD